jgi:hypothetical protein
LRVIYGLRPIEIAEMIHNGNLRDEIFGWIRSEQFVYKSRIF